MNPPAAPLSEPEFVSLAVLIRQTHELAGLAAGSFHPKKRPPASRKRRALLNARARSVAELAALTQRLSALHPRSRVETWLGLARLLSSPWERCRRDAGSPALRGELLRLFDDPGFRSTCAEEARQAYRRHFDRSPREPQPEHREAWPLMPLAEERYLAWTRHPLNAGRAPDRLLWELTYRVAYESGRTAGAPDYHPQSMIGYEAGFADLGHEIYMTRVIV